MVSASRQTQRAFVVLPRPAVSPAARSPLRVPSRSLSSVQSAGPVPSSHSPSRSARGPGAPLSRRLSAAAIFVWTAPSVHYTPVAGRELFSGGRHSTMHNITVSVDTVMTLSCLWDHDHSPTVPLSSSAVHFQTHPDRRPNDSRLPPPTTRTTADASHSAKQLLRPTSVT